MLIFESIKIETRTHEEKKKPFIFIEVVLLLKFFKNLSLKILDNNIKMGECYKKTLIFIIQISKKNELNIHASRIPKKWTRNRHS
jgi:hypothetical protein